ncbi:hypothetical protein GNT65_05760 [Shewanella sp. JBTF-M18]|uniref:Uncharacterized protein n=1 Tax=Shewanella insulae TaxID=2681496 RepID=A0A6L7HW00_9GAMM|nr:hypothetical protein [Shewanella insulae]MXR68180.1 hypothetical protein [Shewanella insulae]
MAIYRLPGEGICKHVFGAQQVHPWMLCEIIHDFEGQNRVYTSISTLLRFGLICFLLIQVISFKEKMHWNVTYYVE